MPRAKRKPIEVMEQKIGQDHPRVLKSTGPSREALQPAIVQPVEKPVDQEKLEMLKFNEDILTVYIHPKGRPDDDEIFEVFNAGQREVFRRGETKQVRRKFVEQLARAKPTNYTNREVFNAGVKDYIYDPSTSLRYPFQVRHDPHPRGSEWLQAILAEA